MIRDDSFDVQMSQADSDDLGFPDQDFDNLMAQVDEKESRVKKWVAKENFEVDSDKNSRFPGVSGIKRKPNDHFQVVLAKKSNLQKTRTDQEICQNELAIFQDENVKENFFKDWIENQKDMTNQLKKVVENNQIFMGREQMLRQKDQDIRTKDQEIIQRSMHCGIRYL